MYINRYINRHSNGANVLTVASMTDGQFSKYDDTRTTTHRDQTYAFSPYDALICAMI